MKPRPVVFNENEVRGLPAVSATPKRFAWSLGLGMALAMTVITNSGIRGYLPRTMCLVCLTLMWMESALGLCLGCKIHGLIARRGWTRRGARGDVCVDYVREDSTASLS